MHFIIKKWPDDSATLMTENGYTLANFSSVEEAKKVCRLWHLSNGVQNHVEIETTAQPLTFAHAYQE